MRRRRSIFLHQTIELCDNCMDRTAIAQYTMSQTGKGEQLLDQGEHQKGAAHIAMGMAYMEQAQIQMVLQSLQMQLPQGIVQLIMQYLRVAKSRTNAHMMEQMFSKQGESKAVGDAPVVSGRKEEPQDVDSIDGDSEEKIIEIEEENNDDAKSDSKTLDDALEIEEVDDTQQLIEDEISDEEEVEAPQPSGNTMQDSQFSVIEAGEEVPEPEVQSEVQPAEEVELPMTDRSVVPESNSQPVDEVEEEQSETMEISHQVEEVEQIQEISASTNLEENTIVVEEESQPEQIEEENLD